MVHEHINSNGEKVEILIDPPTRLQRTWWTIKHFVKRIPYKVTRAIDDFEFAMPLERNSFVWVLAKIRGRKRDADPLKDCDFFQSILSRKHSQAACDGDGHKACLFCRHHKSNSTT